ncbi:hypothetical protein [Bacillus massilinigeriensis]|nr:hypothetical protein [Bacillus massilionigeriensis]
MGLLNTSKLQKKALGNSSNAIPRASIPIFSPTDTPSPHGTGG